VPQQVLSPADTQVVRDETADIRVPPRVRRFGRIPDTSNLLPGDVVLFSATGVRLSSRIIQRAQQHGGYAIEHARWHHVAVYIGDGHILEALTSGVKYRPIYPYSGTHLMRFRRDLNLNPDDRYKIAIQSLIALRQRYSLKLLPRVAWNMTRTLWSPAESIRGTRAVICSQVYVDAYMTVTSRNVCPGLLSDVPPAEISRSNVLSDVHVGWVRLPP
jgi:hypothetical protein